MTHDDGAAGPAAAPPLPESIWVVAWASLAGQVVWLLQEGVRTDGALSLVVSVLLSALLVGYVSAGVVRARSVRLGVAWVVMAVGLVVSVAGLLAADDAADLALGVLSLVSSVAALAAMAAFRHTEWYAWQRTRPPVELGVPTDPLVTIAVVVGVLGGITGPVGGGVDVRISDAGPSTTTSPPVAGWSRGDPRAGRPDA